ncbi:MULTISPECIES: YceI family protein [Delftia]|jgi:polyisoprenoid-binding protein YceI|uniref:YceI family protein n=4 Tax=Pseudomonadati TaxID=3379134 RepID=A9BYX1_DELAS|nr:MULTISPECIES: YceI family protein [Delftia]MCP4016272.1 polyisoprenoid-binding protein [Delftia sp.]OLE95527.1 MAG: polyisoprenoid-binding protein [Delftia sp. 13_1_40CM_3_66_6]PIF39048.1 polyisoprenoid-binding protein YceI [Burkholderiales bacterium 23]ABX34866.1 YceI family protein [Delftia acidovorans SPH-1]AEF91441.1 YceI family protein [Delftia sp. Cs1-4]
MRTSVFALAIAGLFATAVQAAPATYAIDPTHTFATFEIDHNGASTNRVRFDKKSGTVEFDRDAKAGKVEVVLEMESLSSGTAAFDKHLKSADIFNVAKFPQAKFVSDKFVFDGDKLKEVTGHLTILDKTQPVTIKANKFTCYPNAMLQKRETCGGDFEAVIDRTAFGVNYGVDYGFPKQVRLVMSIEAVKQQ